MLPLGLAASPQTVTALGWWLIPGALVLGALHGLEPGHSKTMMTSFIVATRGTAPQAILLGLAATVSHTAVVWIIALAGLYFGRGLNAATLEPYFQLAAAALVAGIAFWAFWRTRRDHARAGQIHGGHAPDRRHEAAHASEIGRRLAGREANVTTSQILAFGLTGGLIPCSAAITVLILCLQLREIVLGASLVLAFSAGLALTLSASGVLAALSLRYAVRAWPGFDGLASKAPCFSAGIMLLASLYVGWQGLSGLVR